MPENHYYPNFGYTKLWVRALKSVKMKELKSLYNGIKNDYSIQRYTIGWKCVMERIEKRFKVIKEADEQFDNEMIVKALSVTHGNLHKCIKNFAKELSLNIESLNEKNQARKEVRLECGHSLTHSGEAYTQGFYVSAPITIKRVNNP